MLAMNPWAPRGVRWPASSLTSIASLLAPTTEPPLQRDLACPARVGASMLAMNPRALRGVRWPASSLTSIASLLAPTEKRPRACFRPTTTPRGLFWPARVGASMLAMNPRALRGVRWPASSLTSIASLLAPTEKTAQGLLPTHDNAPRLILPCPCRSEHARDDPEAAAGVRWSASWLSSIDGTPPGACSLL